MADLVTHFCSGALVGLAVRPRLAGALAFGAVLPDLSGRVPQMALAILKLPIPDRVLWAFDVAHQPVAQVLLAGAIALAFRAEDRREVGLALLGGVALHFGLDVLQDHHGHGYQLFFPFSTARWEAALIGSEATVAWAPWLLALTVALALWRWRAARR